MHPRLGHAVLAGILFLPLVTGCSDDSGATAATQAAAHAPEEAAMTFPVEVAPQTMSCPGAAGKECLQIRRSPNASWELFYGRIEGFDFRPGHRYHLTVEQIPIANPPADAAPVRWKLRAILQDQPGN